MRTKISVWWNKQKRAWCAEIGRKRFLLAKGRRNKPLAEDRLEKLLEERRLLAEVDGVISVAGLCERFLRDAAEHLSPATTESYEYACQKLIEHLGERDAHSILGADIAAFSRSLKRTLNDTSRAIVLRSVQRCFNWGVEAGEIPAHRLGRIHKPRSSTRDRFVTDEEFRALLRATNTTRDDRLGASYRRLLLAMDWTGARPGELARLKWSDIHFDRNVALLRVHKTMRTGKPKVIPLIPKFKRLLQWLKARSTSEVVFLNSRGRPWNRHSIAKRMATITERCGLSEVVPYTMRHRAATNAIVRTGDLMMTKQLLNHASVSTTQRYVHLANDALVAFSAKALG